MAPHTGHLVIGVLPLFIGALLLGFGYFLLTRSSKPKGESKSKDEALPRGGKS